MLFGSYEADPRPIDVPVPIDVSPRHKDNSLRTHDGEDIYMCRRWVPWWIEKCSMLLKAVITVLPLAAGPQRGGGGGAWNVKKSSKSRQLPTPSQRWKKERSKSESGTSNKY